MANIAALASSKEDFSIQERPHTADQSDMPCQFELPYRAAFEPSSSFDPRSENSYGGPCQFTAFGEQDLIEFDGKCWCPFHLPFESEDGEPSGKLTWDFWETARLTGVLGQYISERCLNNKPVDLSGLVHWDRLVLSQIYADDQTVSPPVPIREFPAISLDGAVFKRGVDFSGLIFKSRFTAQGVMFGDQASFNKTRFSGDVEFGGSIFASDVHFLQCEFYGMARFCGVAFESELIFFDSVFKGYSDFSVHNNFRFTPIPFRFKDRGVEDEKSLVRRAIFQRCHFEGPANFNDRQFLFGPIFAGSVFIVAPTFHNCEFHQSVSFEDAKFLDVTSVGADQSYRTLKQAMEKFGARDEQSLFFALEQKARACKTSTPRSVKWFSNLYDLSSAYGQDYIRPLFWLLMVLMAAVVLYKWTISHLLSSGEPSFFALLSISVEQVVRPFQVWFPEYLVKTLDLKAGTKFSDGWMLMFKIVGTVQSLASLGLIAASLLALRRRFKLD